MYVYLCEYINGRSPSVEQLSLSWNVVDSTLYLPVSISLALLNLFCLKRGWVFEVSLLYHFLWQLFNGSSLKLLYWNYWNRKFSQVLVANHVNGKCCVANSLCMSIYLCISVSIRYLSLVYNFKNWDEQIYCRWDFDFIAGNYVFQLFILPDFSSFFF